MKGENRQIATSDEVSKAIQQALTPEFSNF